MAKEIFWFIQQMESKYRTESQKESGFCIHKRKTCECGSIVTAKQLDQYKKCLKCYEK